MIIHGELNPLPVNEIVALLSCVVHDEKVTEDAPAPIPESLKKPIHTFNEYLKRITTVKMESKVPVDEGKEAATLNTALVPLTYAWCQEKSFAEVMKMTSVYEGSVIRMLRRLEELLRQCMAAAKCLGEERLVEKFNE